MKRILTLIMVALMLLTGTFPAMAAKTEKPPANEGETRVCESPKDYKAYAKAYCKKYGDKYNEEFAELFYHTVDALPSDYSKVNKMLPKYLYTHPYNMSAVKVDETTFLENFKTNVQLIKAVGLDEVQKMVNSAKGDISNEINVDYSMDENEYIKRWLPYLPETEESINHIKSEMQIIKDCELTQIGVFLTDPSLVYQGANGAYHVRGRVVMQVKHATKEFLARNDIKLNAWYYADYEQLLIIRVSDKITKYVEQGWVCISNDWKKADAKLIKLAQKQMIV